MECGCFPRFVFVLIEIDWAAVVVAVGRGRTDDDVCLSLAMRGLPRLPRLPACGCVPMRVCALALARLCALPPRLGLVPAWLRSDVGSQINHESQCRRNRNTDKPA